MAGPTAAESLIKAAAAGEGAQEGGGARGKGWKMAGSTGLPPRALRRCRLSSLKPRLALGEAKKCEVGYCREALGVELVKSAACQRMKKNSRGPRQKEYPRAYIT